MSLAEIRPTELGYSKERGWSGYVTYVTEKGNERAYCRSLIDATYANISGDEAPVVTDTKAVWTPHGMNHVSMIRAYYETPRIEGKARLGMGGAYEYKLPKNLMKEDTDDARIIQGPDTDGRHWWVPAVKSGPYPIVKLSTAATSLDIKETLSYIGTMNSSGHSYIFGADAKQLLMLRPAIGRVHGELVMVDYFMAFNLDGWDSVVKSQKGIWIVGKRSVMEWNTTSLKWEPDTSEADRKVLEFVPGKYIDKTDTMLDTEPEDRVVIKEKAWDKLAGLTVW